MKFKKLVKRLNGRKPLLAVLVDPDKYNPALIDLCEDLGVHCLLVGGSRLEKGDTRKTVRDIRKRCSLPVVLFPGDENQLCREADGLLLLSLLSGRNADYLIGKHVKAAPLIRKMRLSTLSTAYLLIGKDGGSSTQAVTLTDPISSNEHELILNTCMAAQQLGFSAIYLEGGSGTHQSISPSLVRHVARKIDLPLIVGGGIDSAKKASTLINAGANMIVVGNALEKNVHLLAELAQCF